MKLRSLIFFSLTALTACLHAAPVAPAFEALLIQPDGTSQRAFLLAATKASVRYRESKDAAEIKDRKLADFASVQVFEPRDYTIAVDLFQSRRYQEAQKAFAALKDFYEPVATLPDNPGTLAAFYELECFRKLGDLDGLSEALKKFNKDPLVRENHLRQIEIYIIWDAVRTKNWSRVESLAEDREKQRLPGCQRAQVSYCHALALEALNRPAEALDAYNTALTADLGASEEISRKSALAILKIHSADPAVKEALKQPSGPATNERLKEAQAIARLFQLSLGAGEPLPEEYRVFLK
jgi:tetratricopeptide (TPR) repeat protein